MRWVMGHEDEASEPSTACHETMEGTETRAWRIAVLVTSTRARRGRPPVTEKG